MERDCITWSHPRKHHQRPDSGLTQIDNISSLHSPPHHQFGSRLMSQGWRDPEESPLMPLSGQHLESSTFKLDITHAQNQNVRTTHRILVSIPWQNVLRQSSHIPATIVVHRDCLRRLKIFLLDTVILAECSPTEQLRMRQERDFSHQNHTLHAGRAQ